LAETPKFLTHDNKIFAAMFGYASAKSNMVLDGFISRGARCEPT
jgi:hypothetical protein